MAYNCVISMAVRITIKERVRKCAGKAIKE